MVLLNTPRRQDDKGLIATILMKTMIFLKQALKPGLRAKSCGNLFITFVEKRYT